jgi:catechol 2,3-dioxygenase-like lactoylglutathione lyase family enzyme
MERAVPHLPADDLGVARDSYVTKLGFACGARSSSARQQQLWRPHEHLEHHATATHDRHGFVHPLLHGKAGLHRRVQLRGFLRWTEHRRPPRHLKRVDEPDPSIPYVEEGGHLHLYFGVEDVATLADRLRADGVPLVKDVHETPWNTREIVIRDDQGHTLYLGESL